MAHLRAKFHGDPTKAVEKLTFRTREGYVHDMYNLLGVCKGYLWWVEQSNFLLRKQFV